MNAPLTTVTAEEDLAYLRNLVDSDRGTRVRSKFGVVYLISGLLWGPYALIVWAANTGRRAPRDTVPTRAFSGVFAGISMLLLMALPGWLMVRRNAAACA